MQFGLVVDTHAMAVNSQDWGINTLAYAMSSDTDCRSYPARCVVKCGVGHLTQYGVMLLVLQTTLPSPSGQHGE